MKRSLGLAAVGLAAVGLAATLGAATPSAAGSRTRDHAPDHWQAFAVVADNLNNPRGLSPAPDGGIYLAESGSGGKACTANGYCYGLTGSFDLVTSSGVKRLVPGLLSRSGGPQGIAAYGAVAVSRGPDGTFYGQFAVSSHEVPPAGAIPANLRNAALAEFGHLVLVKRHRFVRGASPLVTGVSDVGDQDWTWTSTRINLAPHDYPAANPNGVLYSGRQRYVVDAGANILVDVKRNGAANVVAFFPVPAGWQSDSVPTCVARGPDGALYVGELLGGFYGPGHARIWRLVPGHTPTVWATGLTAVNGCGFGEDGAFYATEFQSHGWSQDPNANPAGDVVRIDRYGHRTHLGVGKLFFPAGFAPGPDGSVYVSNCSIAPAAGMGPQLCPAGGEVVRLR